MQCAVVQRKQNVVIHMNCGTICRMSGYIAYSIFSEACGVLNPSYPLQSAVKLICVKCGVKVLECKV